MHFIYDTMFIQEKENQKENPFTIQRILFGFTVSADENGAFGGLECRPDAKRYTDFKGDCGRASGSEAQKQGRSAVQNDGCSREKQE